MNYQIWMPLYRYRWLAQRMFWLWYFVLSCWSKDIYWKPKKTWFLHTQGSSIFCCFFFNNTSETRWHYVLNYFSITDLCVINTFFKKYMIYFCNICCNIFIFHLFIFETALYLKSLYFHFYFCEIRAKLFSRKCTYANFTSISNFILYRYFAVSEILFRQCKLCCSLFNFIYCIYYFVGYVVSFILK